MAKQSKRIGELLVDADIITAGQLRDALGRQRENGRRTVENLIDQGYLNEHTFEIFLAHQPGTPSICVASYYPTREVIALLPREFVIERQMFPLDRLGRLLTVAMVCPLDMASIAAAEELTGLNVRSVLCRSEDMRHVIARYYPDHDSPSILLNPKGTYSR